MIKVLEEYNRLLKVEVHYSGGLWILTPREYKNGDKVSGRGEIKFRGTPIEFSKFLRKIQAKDSSDAPPSSRLKTYNKIVTDIENRTDRFIWIWSTKWKSTPSIVNLFTY